MRLGGARIRTGWHTILILIGGPLVVLDSLYRIFKGKFLVDHAYFDFIDAYLIAQIGKPVADVVIGLLELGLFALFVKFTWREIEEK